MGEVKTAARRVKVIHALSCALRHGQNGKFHVMYILQLKNHVGEGHLVEGEQMDTRWERCQASRWRKPRAGWESGCRESATYWRLSAFSRG